MRGSVRFSSGALTNFIRIYKNVDKMSNFYYLEWIYDQELWPPTSSILHVFGNREYWCISNIKHSTAWYMVHLNVNVWTHYQTIYTQPF